MKKILLFPLILAMLAFWLSPVMAFEMAVVQTSSAAPYEKSYQGFLHATAKSKSSWGRKSISPDSSTRIILSELGPSFDLHDKLHSLHPDIIIAIGRHALVRVKDFSEVPVIHMLAPFPPEEVQSNPNITGIDLNIPPAKQLSAFLEVLPSVKKIGTVYNPSETGKLVLQAEAFAALKGIELVSVKAANDKEAIQQLARLQDDVDAFWMLPDRSLLTPVFTESLLRFSFKNKIPLLTFADKYLEMGATLALAADPYAMGEQAGLLAMQRLKVANPEGMEENYAAIGTVSLNEKIAQKIGIITNTAALKSSSAQMIE